MGGGRDGVNEAVRRIDADLHRTADTHLVPLSLLALPGIRVYRKDESTPPSGSLRHRLARSLSLHGLCNAWIGEGATVVEASSGSSAVSVAYFARLLGLPFVAVMPRSTSPEKIRAIEFQGAAATWSTTRPRCLRRRRALRRHLLRQSPARGGGPRAPPGAPGARSGNRG